MSRTCPIYNNEMTCCDGCPNLIGAAKVTCALWLFDKPYQQKRKHLSAELIVGELMVLPSLKSPGEG